MRARPILIALVPIDPGARAWAGAGAAAAAAPARAAHSWATGVPGRRRSTYLGARRGAAAGAGAGLGLQGMVPERPRDPTAQELAPGSGAGPAAATSHSPTLTSAAAALTTVAAAATVAAAGMAGTGEIATGMAAAAGAAATMITGEAVVAVEVTAAAGGTMTEVPTALTSATGRTDRNTSSAAGMTGRAGAVHRTLGGDRRITGGTEAEAGGDIATKGTTGEAEAAVEVMVGRRGTATTAVVAGQAGGRWAGAAAVGTATGLRLPRAGPHLPSGPRFLRAGG